MIAVNYLLKHNVFAYPKREHYCFNRFCFEMARQITLSTELRSSVDSHNWRAISKQSLLL
jgi:hypothetical protein